MAATPRSPQRRFNMGSRNCARSEKRRVGEEGRSPGWPDYLKKKKKSCFGGPVTDGLAANAKTSDMPIPAHRTINLCINVCALSCAHLLREYEAPRPRRCEHMLR